MTTVNAVRDRILTLCGERNISINKLATLCALPPSSVKNILYGQSQNPKLLTVKMICDGLDMTLAEFLTPRLSTRLNPKSSNLRKIGKMRVSLCKSVKTCYTVIVNPARRRTDEVIL